MITTAFEKEFVMEFQFFLKKWDVKIEENFEGKSYFANRRDGEQEIYFEAIDILKISEDSE